MEVGQYDPKRQGIKGKPMKVNDRQSIVIRETMNLRSQERDNQFEEQKAHMRHIDELGNLLVESADSVNRPAETHLDESDKSYEAERVRKEREIFF